MLLRQELVSCSSSDFWTFVVSFVGQFLAHKPTHLFHVIVVRGPSVSVFPRIGYSPRFFKSWRLSYATSKYHNSVNFRLPEAYLQTPLGNLTPKFSNRSWRTGRVGVCTAHRRSSPCEPCVGKPWPRPRRPSQRGIHPGKICKCGEAQVLETSL